MYKKKYEKGEVIEDLNELLHALVKEGYVYYRHKIYHSGWATSWQLRFIIVAIEKGWLYRAKKIIK